MGRWSGDLRLGSVVTIDCSSNDSLEYGRLAFDLRILSEFPRKYGKHLWGSNIPASTESLPALC